MNDSEKLQRLLAAVKPICWAVRRGKPTLNKDLEALSEAQQLIESDLPFNTPLQMDAWEDPILKAMEDQIAKNKKLRTDY